MPVARTYNNNVWSASGTPAPAVPTPVEAPKPTTPAPAVAPWAAAGKQAEWWKSRGGHELYDIFARIEKENPMAARAFWDQVVGTGRGMNDLSAATIHKKFGGDMNAYNNWRNLYHGNSMDSYAGYFDLGSGKWTPGQAFNSQYVKDRLGWDVTGPWQSSWNWGDYQNTLKTGLQSTPGNEDAGAESWNTYLAGAHFGPRGVQYPGVAEQASIAAGGVNPYANQYAPRADGRSRTINPEGSYLIGKNPSKLTAPPPAVPTPNPGPAPAPVPTTTNPTGSGPSTVNPTSSAGGYRYNPSRS